MSSNPKIVVIGGGTGNFTLLQQFKNHTKNITAIVNMADDGGSTGVLRDEFGVLPPGDVRQCLVALSPESSKVRQLFSYRFDNGAMEGHAFGNLFLTALEKMTGSFAEAVETASEVLRITGKVIPITLDNVRLVLHMASNTKIYGEARIDVLEFENSKMLPELSLDPRAEINKEAERAVLDADVIVISPGDIYTSLGPTLIVDGVSEVLKKTQALKVYVCNLVTKPGQTDGFMVDDFADEIERFAGGPMLDYVLYNTGKPDVKLFQKYAKVGENLVLNGQSNGGSHYKKIGANLVSRTAPIKVQTGDSLAPNRSYIRHDGDTVARTILDLWRGKTD